MHPRLSKADLALLIDAANVAAARLRHRLGLPRVDLEDLRQDLLIDLIRRLPAFDARGGTIGAFAGILLRSQSARIARRIARERRARGGALLSLEAKGRDGKTRGNRLGENDGLATWHGQSAADTAIERRIDLAWALGALSQQDRALCAAVARCPVLHLPEQGFGSRATVYRRIAELRLILTARAPGGVRQFSNRVSNNCSGGHADETRPLHHRFKAAPHRD